VFFVFFVFVCAWRGGYNGEHRVFSAALDANAIIPCASCNIIRIALAWEWGEGLLFLAVCFGVCVSLASSKGTRGLRPQGFFIFLTPNGIHNLLEVCSVELWDGALFVGEKIVLL
jgi:hypothetical protein